MRKKKESGRDRAGARDDGVLLNHGNARESRNVLYRVLPATAPLGHRLLSRRQTGGVGRRTTQDIVFVASTCICSIRVYRIRILDT